MKLLRKILLAFLALAVVLATAGGVGAYFIVRCKEPMIAGTVRLKGLYSDVEVLRDRWGVPHVYAGDPADLFFAQGYVVAQDRLWQMELQRRAGRGTLSEVLGDTTLKLDELSRTLGFERGAQRDLASLDSFARQAIDSYAQGVNAYIAAGELPLEFTILRFKPGPFEATDALAWGKIMAWSLSANWDTEVSAAKLAATLGEKEALSLLPSYPPGALVIVPTRTSYVNTTSSEALASAEVLGLLSLSPAARGSNNWVVDGAKSTTGKPLLANDPHLTLENPSLWYMVHLVAADFEVEGASLPGTPGVVLGHNRNIAWGMTNVGADVEDLYLEKLNPNNPHQYLYRGKWEDGQVLAERIAVKGRSEPVVREVLITRHGPLVDSVIDGLFGPTALRWTALDPSPIIASALGINRARNWADFREALESWSVPSQNFVYADVEGNIGYQLPGLIPIRSRGDGLLPVPGWTGEYEWAGYVPFEQLPSLYNPSQHFIVTANNKVVDDHYPYLIAREWDPGFRSQRISEMLSAKEKLSAEDFRSIQTDVHSPAADELLRAALELKPPDPQLRRAIEYWRTWDRNVTSDSVPASLLEVFYVNLMRNTFSEKLGADLFQDYQKLTRSHSVRLLELLNGADADWREVTGGRTRAEVMNQSLRDTVDYLGRVLGPDMAQWRWGRLHRTTLSHALGQVPLLDRVFNLGPFERSGDAATVNNGAFDLATPYDSQVGPSYRQIIDLSDFSRSLFVYPGGQSGRPFSQHYGDLIQPWLRGEYYPLLFSRESVEANLASKLTLKPL